jgi:hypothetical protein
MVIEINKWTNDEEDNLFLPVESKVINIEENHHREDLKTDKLVTSLKLSLYEILIKYNMTKFTVKKLDGLQLI